MPTEDAFIHETRCSYKWNLIAWSFLAVILCLELQVLSFFGLVTLNSGYKRCNKSRRDFLETLKIAPNLVWTWIFSRFLENGNLCFYPWRVNSFFLYPHSINTTYLTQSCQQINGHLTVITLLWQFNKHHKSLTTLDRCFALKCELLQLICLPDSTWQTVFCIPQRINRPNMCHHIKKLKC